MLAFVFYVVLVFCISEECSRENKIIQMKALLKFSEARKNYFIYDLKYFSILLVELLKE